MAKTERQLTEAEARDKQRHDDRAAELARQDEVNEAMQAFYDEQQAAGQKALEDQIEKEVHGITVVESKP